LAGLGARCEPARERRADYSGKGTPRQERDSPVQTVACSPYFA
jgi:hypothetical protein